MNNLDIENSTIDANNFSSPDPPGPENYLNVQAETDLPWNEQIINFCETRFAGFFEIGIPAFLVSYLFFFGIGGFLHVRIYFEYFFIFKTNLNFLQHKQAKYFFICSSTTT